LPRLAHDPPGPFDFFLIKARSLFLWILPRPLSSRFLLSLFSLVPILFRVRPPKKKDLENSFCLFLPLPLAGPVGTVVSFDQVEPALDPPLSFQHSFFVPSPSPPPLFFFFPVQALGKLLRCYLFRAFCRCIDFSPPLPPAVHSDVFYVTNPAREVFVTHPLSSFGTLF